MITTSPLWSPDPNAKPAMVLGGRPIFYSENWCDNCGVYGKDMLPAYPEQLWQYNGIKDLHCGSCRAEKAKLTFVLEQNRTRHPELE